MRYTRGFALLITITLLAFLVLLLVSLSSMTRVETQVADNTKKLSNARANAMMALNLALGQLQKYAGPDKAVSARADVTSAGALTQPYLTGIWKTSNATSAPDIWLVSGNESSPVAKTPSNVLSPAAGTEPVVDGASGYVFLVGSNSVAANDQRVRLDKQPITAAAGTIPGLTTAATIGNYAYWVGDEGIKASASLINPLLTANAIAYDNATGSGGQGDDWIDVDKRARLDQMQLNRPRLEHLFPTLNPDTNGLASLPNIKNNSQLLLMASAPTAAQLKAQFYSLTPLGRAVLVDLPNGRLKKDLSDITASPDPAILKYQQTRLTPGAVFTSYYTPVAASVPTATAYPAHSLGPVLTEVGIRFNFYISTADNTVHFSYLIEAELWNPYAAELRLTTSAPLTLEIQGIPAITVTTDGATNVSFVQTIATTVNAAAASTWAAGQTRVFRGGTALEPVASPAPMFDYVVPGATADGTATTVTATYPAADLDFYVVVKIGGNVLATYKPTITFGSGSVSNGTAPTSTGWLLGYGYEFADDLSVFTNGAAATSFDPRLPVLSGVFHNAASTVWTTTPANNTGSIGISGTFGSGNMVTLYDLPRQEITSLGVLTHIIGAKPATVGSPWGGAANALYDQYHVSTVPRFSATWTPESGMPLPNRYAEVYHPDSTPAIPITDLRSSANSARYLLQTGAFNINSTSVEAWNAVLGSKLAAWRYPASTITGIELDNVFFRLPHGAQQLANPPLILGGTGTSALTDTNAQNTGGRQLTPAEVTTLATQIVSQIRAHTRPYVSLQDFINSGVIANAISAANLNGSLGTKNRFAPGALTQADVIGALAPFITARSDTFIIRAYGDAQNPVTGTVEGRAWCEALVQRLPDLADNASAPIADVVTPNTATYPSGRKFKIISFRWLSASDI